MRITLAVVAPLLLATATTAVRAQPLFTMLPQEATGVSFVNVISERPGANVLEYEYFYNGGGVAIGDLDNDGLADLFLTANAGRNALYRNTGDLRFEDVTGRSGVEGGDGWTTGVTMADVNGDGLLDIYVLRSGNLEPSQRRNQLFINQGNFRFREEAKRMGLDDAGYATHAVFFDYDRDGDLDVFIVNHNIRRLARFDVELIRRMRDPDAGDKLLRNDDGRFVDVSVEAGIIANPIGFGLSAAVSDINGDGWPDIYVANDYVEDDYLYINQQDGTFREDIRSYLDHTSYFSMGTDIADINNDGLPDIVTLDMLPPDNRRQKLLKGPDHYDYYHMMIGYGYHHQHMRNMLHLNNGDGTFSEIGQLSGISNTDWSWAPLLADFDNDGFSDLYVTNGYVRDYTNMDFLKFTMAEAYRQARAEGREPNAYELVRQMPSSRLSNFMFRNRGDLTFEDATEAWGLFGFSLSNGAAYGDLDGDGDLDLVVHNINAPAAIYRNEAAQTNGNRFLRVRLEGPEKNPFGVGATVRATLPSGGVLTRSLMPSRGYQSSVDPVLHFGLGDVPAVDLAVAWPDGAVQNLADVQTNQTLVVRRDEASTRPSPPEQLPSTVFDRADDLVPFAHVEDEFIDFKREPLLPHMLSRLGPALAAADVDGDGLVDLFLGGARGQSSVILRQHPDGRFVEHQILEADARFEDVDATFLDVDADGRTDLYVASGGNDEPAGSTIYQDRLYLNEGDGTFRRAIGMLPELTASGGCVAAHDFDDDGDVDLFVGGRSVPGSYPLAPRSYLLENSGGRFSDVTQTIAPMLVEPGMVATCTWADVTGDGSAELVIGGEWMPIRIFAFGSNPMALEVTEAAGLSTASGWWNDLVAADLDGDGDLDLVAGNRGLNAQMKASADEPARIYAMDIDGNGTIDPLITYFIEGASYPSPSRDELLDQVTALKKVFTDYASYSHATIEDILTPEQIEAAAVLEATVFETMIFENDGAGSFRARSLPIQAQFAPVNAIVVEDVDQDGHVDIILGGNDFGARAQTGRFDAGRGLLLRGSGNLRFEAVPAPHSGLSLRTDVRRLRLIPTPRGPVLVVGNNGDAVITYAVRRES